MGLKIPAIDILFVSCNQGEGDKRLQKIWRNVFGLITVFLAATMIAAPAGSVSAKAAPKAFLAGAAKASISPTSEDLRQGVYMGGYGAYLTRGKATGVHDDIYARALAVSSGDDKAVFVTLDTAGIGNLIMDAIRNEASEQTGIPADAIVVSATHTHSGPDLQGLWGGGPQSYKEYLVSQTVSAIEAACIDMKHVTLVAGSVQVDQDLANNRRGFPNTDTAMTVLQFKNKGDTLATLVNLAVHPTVISGSNKQISSDFVGSLESAVDTKFGGTTLFVNGAQGDAVPNVAWGGDEYAKAAAYGSKLADFVSAAVADSKLVPPGILLKSAKVTFEVQNPAFIAADHLGFFESYASMRPDSGKYYIDSRVVRLRLGNDGNQVEMVSIPGEAVTELGLGLREIMGGKQNVLLGLTHDTLGYLIPEDQWMSGRNNNYEESVSLGREAGEKVRTAVKSLYE